MQRGFCFGFLFYFVNYDVSKVPLYLVLLVIPIDFLNFTTFFSKAVLSLQKNCVETTQRDFPGGPVARTPCSQ